LGTAIDQLRRKLIDSFGTLLGLYVAITTRNIAKELARREAARGRGDLRWFTPDEAAIAEALANIIVPSDEETPGLEEVCVLGPPAIVALDDLIAESSERRYWYARGLLSFDTWALHQRGCKFANMSKEDQRMLFRAAEQIHASLTQNGTAVLKAWRRLLASMRAGTGSFFAARLYPQIRNDCLQVFYTSRVSWVWLEYDGPPMDKGYPSLVAPR
jgi:hypothetical protein